MGNVGSIGMCDIPFKILVPIFGGLAAIGVRRQRGSYSRIHDASMYASNNTIQTPISELDTFLVLGIDGSGKSTFIETVVYGFHRTPVPTVGYMSERLKISSTQSKKDSFEFYRMLELGGHQTVRHMWESLITGTFATDHGVSNIRGVFFVIDAAASGEHFTVAKSEFIRVLQFESLRNKPFCILCNKVDVEHHIDANSMLKMLDIESIISTGTAYTIIETSAISGIGLPDAIKWMINNV